MSTMYRNGYVIQKVLALFVCIFAVGFILSGCTKTPKKYRIGILVGSDYLDFLVDSFKESMADLGYIEGKNILYDVQRSKSDPTEERRIAGKFITDKVDLVFVFPGRAAQVIKAALRETNIPIVFTVGIIEGTDLVDSIHRPGGNITGVRVPGSENVVKSFEALLELSPKPQRVMIIFDPKYPANPPIMKDLRLTASSFHVTLREFHITDINDVSTILQNIERSDDINGSAILLLPDLPRSAETCQLVFDFADKHRLPVAGGPTKMGKAIVFTATAGKSAILGASLVDQVLKGASAGTIPILTPEPQLIVNYSKIQELGLTVPKGLLKRATEISR